MSPEGLGLPRVSRQAQLCPLPPNRKCEQQEVVPRSREEQVRHPEGPPRKGWLRVLQLGRGMGHVGTSEVAVDRSEGRRSSVGLSPVLGEAWEPSPQQDPGRPAGSWVPTHAGSMRRPQEPSQQSAHPREIFKQKERAMPTASIASPQPGETSLCAQP